MAVPTTYRKDRENILVNYNYTDIAEGTGMQTFYALKASSYKLNQNAFVSSTKEIGTTPVVVGQAFDIDFDLSMFNTPKTITGTAFIEFSQYAKKTIDLGTHNMHSNVTFKIIHYDGTTETIIGQSESMENYVGFDSQIIKQRKCIALNLTEKHFKKGDILRLNIVASLSYGETGEKGIIVVGCDPLNRDGTYIKPSTDDMQTQLKLNIPFKLDL